MDFQLKNSILSPLNKIYFSKKSIRILLSLSVFSFLFSQLPHHLYLSTFSSRLFSFSTERNYIFLLCNGVILVIIKTSGLSAPSGMEGSRNNGNKKNIHDEAFRNKDDKKTVQKSCNKSFTSNSLLIVEAKTEITETIENKNDMTRVENDENVTLTAHYEVKIEEENDKILKMVKELEEQQIVNTGEYEEENEGLLSLDELNKKCEDFIRKMKHEIIIEDRQLIMV